VFIFGIWKEKRLVSRSVRDGFETAESEVCLAYRQSSSVGEDREEAEDSDEN
jgi:hypothetical protein